MNDDHQNLTTIHAQQYYCRDAFPFIHWITRKRSLGGECEWVGRWSASFNFRILLGGGDLIDVADNNSCAQSSDNALLLLLLARRGVFSCPLHKRYHL